MKTKNTYEVVKYFELDERVNFENYKRTAVKINFDKDVFYDWIDLEGNELFEDGFRHYDEISEWHFQDPDKADYFSNTYVERGIYKYAQKLLNDCEVDFDLGTLCMLIVYTRYEARSINSLYERVGQTDEEFEFLKFHKALWEIVNDNMPATALSVNTCTKQLIKTQYPKYTAKVILESLEATSKRHFPTEYYLKRRRYLQYDFSFKEIKDFYEGLRHREAKRMNELFMPIIPKQSTRYFFIDQLFAIAEYGNHSLVQKGCTDYGRKRDNSIRKMKEVFKR